MISSYEIFIYIFIYVYIIFYHLKNSFDYSECSFCSIIIIIIIFGVQFL